MELNGTRCSMNITQEDCGQKPTVLGPKYHHQVRVYTLVTMIVFSLLGNLTMCLHIKQKWHHRSAIHVLFLNLAVADILVTLVTMCSQLVWEFMDREWIAGDVFCRTFKVCQTFTMVSSNYMLLAIALDRHTAIVYPLFRNARTKALITSAWVLSLLPSLPNAYVFQTVTLSDGRAYCVAKFYTSSLSLFHRQVYMALILLAVFILPILIIIILYSRIIYTMWTRSGSLDRFRSRKEHFIDPTRKGKRTKRQSLDTSNSQISRAKIKTLKMTLAIVSTFLTASTPYLVQEIIIAFGNPSLLNQNVVAFFGIFSASNSALNPYIYFVFNSNTPFAKKIAHSTCNCCLPVSTKTVNETEKTSHV
ncbi:vasopressin V1b receptor-like [Limulus polyphemus]|uniref:Vasopressin V1b receptor-like n=1 Tax=Limulus polyphemus TaxID=6850 RepID=A0ABM1TQG2_LIMPO|nr:vasopressin V1b receptor-like [Limulus polyphemus]XP_022258118.1 vasopressin V1b receptor-like [Limulus polyphemus]